MKSLLCVMLVAVLLLSGNVYVPGQSLSIYINGVLDNQRTDSVPSSQYNNSLALTLGARPSKECYFRGTADEICIYNRVLTQAEITSLAGLKKE